MNCKGQAYIGDPGLKFFICAHTFVACIRNRSSLATFRNMADMSLLVKYVHGCTQNLNENLSYCMSEKH
jgi:hypothetical protein